MLYGWMFPTKERKLLVQINDILLHALKIVPFLVVGGNRVSEGDANYKKA